MDQIFTASMEAVMKSQFQQQLRPRAESQPNTLVATRTKASCESPIQCKIEINND